MTPSPRGTLFLVVGPSGAGKDSLLDGARRAFAGRDDVVFVKRVITRPADSGGEEHTAASEADFADMVAAGRFALHWDAHGLRYGVPVDIADALAAGKVVIVNVSRGAIDEARAKFPPVRVLSVSVPENELRRRLLARGREDTETVEKRVARAKAYTLDGDDVIAIDNGGALDDAVAAFVAAIEGHWHVTLA